MTRSNQALSTSRYEKPERKLRAPGAKVRAAIDLMVWQGHHRDEAAKLAGMNPKSLYNAFRKMESQTREVGNARATPLPPPAGRQICGSAVGRIYKRAMEPQKFPRSKNSRAQTLLIENR
jgi:hypothetical protein